MNQTTRAVSPVHRTRRHPREQGRDRDGGRHPIATLCAQRAAFGAVQPVLTRPRRVLQLRSIGRRVGLRPGAWQQGLTTEHNHVHDAAGP